jgi:hypothetical protein
MMWQTFIIFADDRVPISAGFAASCFAVCILTPILGHEFILSQLVYTIHNWKNNRVSKHYSTMQGQGENQVASFISKKRREELNAPAGNRTRVCTVAGYYSTTRPLVLRCFQFVKEICDLVGSCSGRSTGGRRVVRHGGLLRSSRTITAAAFRNDPVVVLYSRRAAAPTCCMIITALSTSVSYVTSG